MSDQTHSLMLGNSSWGAVKHIIESEAEDVITARLRRYKPDLNASRCWRLALSQSVDAEA